MKLFTFKREFGIGELLAIGTVLYLLASDHIQIHTNQQDINKLTENEEKVSVRLEHIGTQLDEHLRLQNKLPLSMTK